MKVCTFCLKKKEDSAFTTTTHVGNRYPHSRCIKCMSIYNKAYKQNGMLPISKKALRQLKEQARNN